MKIKDILEALKQGKSLADLGKEIAVGKEKLSASLKKAGYKFIRKEGWTFIGEGTEPLDQDYTEFLESSKSVKIVNASIEAFKEIASTIETPAKESNVKASRKTVTSELDSIDVLLLQNQEESENRTYRGFYWDKDIISFLDGIKHGNKSDLMNEIVRTVLKDKGLLK
ncbi:hypothetical protein HRG49_13275 [Enterococcus faecalis]|jgi:hypothetical protein|uniref:hypothetical protein n=1 Tax=Bacillus TaxID=1386 RepID=UPI000DC2AF46|nr:MULTISPECIES: hypothetical protein [Bacillus]NST54694.1 hypothetical protein [Enterococcus faecalis]RAN67603.1 hypothetical protein B5P40_24365 [Bacillus sp. SRB_8]WJE74221.1 hypothetical protein QRE62_03620 [Bacillus mycoides]